MKRTIRFFPKIFLVFIAIVAGSVTFAHSANVTLRWDANVPAPEGYRVFIREGSQSYNYKNPIKTILTAENTTECTLIGLIEGTAYHFVVRAYDGALESADSEEVSYTPAVVVPNQTPHADAGDNQTVYEAASVTLDGSGSTDADGTLSNYQWVQTGGTGVSLFNATAAQASFTAPVVDFNGETLTFTLTVTDDDGSSSIGTTTVSVLKSSSTDVDGDNVPDVLDLFPNDPDEWADNDGDGTGDNEDADDDNDGMPDTWEAAFGLDPFTNDAALDADGDGVTNFQEFQSDSNPTTAPSNTVPDAPVIDSATQIELVTLTPVLVSSAYFDLDNDDHFQSQWQISTESDFSTLILDETSETQLTAYTVGEMVLDVETIYHWRVRFIDERNGMSDWSEVSTFTTVDSADDTNTNGIPDAQEVDASVDVNENGIADYLEDTIMTVNTVEGQSIVGVEVVSDQATLVSAKSLPTDTIADQSVKMGFGLIGFKLYLQDGVTSATVKIHFSSRVPKDANLYLYKYVADSGWQVYDNSVFAPNRKSVTLLLEDGGVGDEDGVRNGVIVDPSGIAYTDSLSPDSAAISTGADSSGGGGGGGCFISAGTQDLRALDSNFSNGAMLVLTMMLATGIVFATVRHQVTKKN
jgi:hypothetical protein